MTKKIFFHLFSIALILLLFGLSFWQIQRKDVKEAAIAEIEGQKKISAVPLSRYDLRYDLIKNYKKYILEGVFLPERIFFVFTPSYGDNAIVRGAGYWVIIPFLLNNTDHIIPVNMGFVRINELPKIQALEISDISLLSQKLSIQAMARPYEKKRIWHTEAEIKNNILYGFYRDNFIGFLGDNIAHGHYFQLTQSAEIFSPLLVRKALTTIKLRNNHLSYAWTWFILGISISVFYSYLVFSRKRYVV